jgi:hypothetical protein
MRGRRAAEQAGARHGVGAVPVGEVLLPVRLDAVDHADDAAVLRLVGIGAGTAFGREAARRRCATAAGLAAADELAGVDPEDHGDDQRQEADRSAADGHAAYRHATGVLDLGRVQSCVVIEIHAELLILARRVDPPCTRDQTMTTACPPHDAWPRDLVFVAVPGYGTLD